MNKKTYSKILLRKLYHKIIGIVLIVLIFSGCGRDVSILKGETMEDSFETERADENEMESKDTKDTQEQQNIVTQQEDSDGNASDHNASELITYIYVDLGGAVKHPGVYSLPEGSRVFEVIALAGGFMEDAYTRQINQADILEDGEQIYVLNIQEAEEMLSQGTLSDTSTPSQEEHDSGKVDLNKAEKEDLMTLTGIGATRAEAILQYRAEHGGFRSIEELMQVEGIKEKTYEKIKDCITVQ